MYKKFIYLFLIICVSLGLSGCKAPKTVILFNNYPITKENLLSNASEFTVGKRIYYIFLTQNPLKTNLIRVRVLKKEGKDSFEPIKLVYSNDFRLNKDQVYYYNDYIVMNDSGDYTMVIYSRDELDKPLVIADFRVKK